MHSGLWQKNAFLSKTQRVVYFFFSLLQVAPKSNMREKSTDVFIEWVQKILASKNKFKFDSRIPRLPSFSKIAIIFVAEHLLPVYFSRKKFPSYLLPDS